MTEKDNINERRDTPITQEEVNEIYLNIDTEVQKVSDASKKSGKPYGVFVMDKHVSSTIYYNNIKDENLKDFNSPNESYLIERVTANIMQNRGVKNLLAESDDLDLSRLKESPTAEFLKKEKSAGDFNLIAGDPNNKFAKTDRQLRENGQKGVVLSQNENFMAVYGLEHLSDLQGYQDGELRNALLRRQRVDGFQKKTGSANLIDSKFEVLYINSVETSRPEMQLLDRLYFDKKDLGALESKAEILYALNPVNAYRVNIPGNNYKLSLEQIDAMVKIAEINAKMQKMGLSSEESKELILKISKGINQDGIVTEEETGFIEKMEIRLSDDKATINDVKQSFQSINSQIEKQNDIKK